LQQRSQNIFRDKYSSLFTNFCNCISNFLWNPSLVCIWREHWRG